jgi:hypothetical protein
MSETPRASATASRSETELRIRSEFLSLFKQSPIPDEELLENLGLFIKRQDFSRMLFMHELYQQILPVHGVVIEFGVRWGQNMALFATFRGIYEPFNFNRQIIGFDTFEGFPSVRKGRPRQTGQERRDRRAEGI